MKFRHLFAAALLLASVSLHAAELRLFGKGEMARVLAERQGRPFILTLWSTDCPHCKGTLRQLATLAKANPRLDLVVVSTDSADERATIAAMLAGVGLGDRDTWVFSGSPERMRYEIDRRWGGEMPRTYLYDRDHHAEAFSGPVEDAALRQWLERGVAGRERR
ncbi:MAG: TlpA family protein disulfide reductase [Ignavibacteria bacterium]